MSKAIYQSTMQDTVRRLACNLGGAGRSLTRRIAGAARPLGHSVGAGAVLALYMIIPAMVALSPVLSGNWNRLLAGLALLAVGEAAVITILAKIGSPDRSSASHEERRGAVRVLIDFGVEVGNAFEAATGLLQPLRVGSTLNASRDGLAVLVDRDWSAGGKDYVSLRMSLPGGSTGAKARIVASEQMDHGDHGHRLLRLRLVAMDQKDRHRYFQYLAGLEPSAATAA